MKTTINQIKGIYTITNIVNGKYYVGSSLNIKKENKFEVNLLHNGKNHYKTVLTEIEAYEYVKALRQQLNIIY